MFAADLAARLPDAKRRGEWFDVSCPVSAHGGDARPSLPFRDDAAKQRIALHCRKGCTPPEIASGFGLTLADLHHHGPARNGARPRAVAEYLYTDERGAGLFAVERLDPKDFRQKRPTAGGWVYGLGAVRRVVFGLPEIQGQHVVYIVEGERDVLTLRAAGLVATCNPMGAGKWTADYTRQLADAGGRDVYILPDHDDKGRAHAEHVADSCHAAGIVVKVIALPALPLKGDVTDWLGALGHTPAELTALATSVTVWAPAVTGGALTTVWSLAKSAEELIAAGGVTLEAVDYPLAARGSITEINAPRGTGKSALVLAGMVAQARRGLRVLYLDRDNSPATLRKRLVGLGAGTVPTLKVLTRDVAPPFSDVEAWRVFPLEQFDVVVADSWDTFAEGAGEQDSRRSTLAMAPVLDMVRREQAPAVILLCNVTKDGKAGRGSGTVEDRADNVFAVRDATGFTPTGKRPWWEELPPAARSEWAARATRRSGQDRPERIRLAFIASKFRDDDDPAPFVLELDFTAEPWALRDVTAELVAAGDQSQAAGQAQATQAREKAADALVAELARRAADNGAKLLLVEPAIKLLIAYDLKRRAARELLKGGGAGRWRLEPLDGRSVAVILESAVRFPGVSAQSEPFGICTPERAAALPNHADRMDTERRDSNPAAPAKHAGGVMSADCAAENGYTRDRGDEGEV